MSYRLANSELKLIDYDFSVLTTVRFVMRLFRNADCRNIDQADWRHSAFVQFEQALSSTTNLFPCALGVAGFNADQLRYQFADCLPWSSESARFVAGVLQSYLPVARQCGKNTSLAIFFNCDSDLGVEKYQAAFWSLLTDIHALDSCKWPDGISTDPDSHLWEFSFGGEPIFVVCNTPSHKKRLSRYSSYFMITFQPRWVFDGVIGVGSSGSEKIKDIIRGRLHTYDLIPPSPDLGSFGDPSNREWKQYFLSDASIVVDTRCPFGRVRSRDELRLEKTGVTNLVEVISALLPPTGSVEVQVDTPSRIHPEHVHSVDETLHIVEGEITFQAGDLKLVCRPGDRLLLPANTKHASTSGTDGCLYVIATRIVSHQDQFQVSGEGDLHVF